jgi:alpha-ketoglutarate-dependent taurine dioxygenase
MAELQVRNLRPEFGSEVRGLEPNAPLDADTIRQLRKLFDERSVLVFPDLNPSARFQAYLSQVLIRTDEVDPATVTPMEDFQVSNREEKATAPFGRLLFHCDMMWVASGCLALSLYGKEVGQPAVPTLFVSSGNGWDSLPDDLRKRVEGRSAVHCQDATAQRRNHISSDVLVSTFEVQDFLTLPVGYNHPRTGRTMLYVCPQMTHHIEGMDHAESEALLEALFDHLYSEEQILEHHWQQGDLVVWDNQAMQHARPNVTAQAPTRTLRKCIAPIPNLNQKAPAHTLVGDGMM